MTQSYRTLNKKMGFFNYSYDTAAVSGVQTDTVKIYGVDVPKTIMGQPTEYIAGAVGLVSMIVLKGGLNIVGAVAGLGTAAAVYLAKNNMLPGNTQSAYGYVYNYTDDTANYYSPMIDT